jgi:hypothetical protein
VFHILSWFKKIFEKEKKSKKDISKADNKNVAETTGAAENESLVILADDEFREILLKYIESPDFSDTCLLFDPQETNCYVFKLSEYDAFDLDVFDLSAWPGVQEKIKHLFNKCISIDDKRYACIVSLAFTNLGERAIIKLFADDFPSQENLKEEKRKVIRLVNRLKPATALTMENIVHLLDLLEKNKDKTVTELLECFKEDGTLEEEEFTNIKDIDNLRQLIGQPLARKKIVKAIAHLLKAEYIDVELTDVSEEVARKIPENIARKYLVVAFEEDEDKVKVALWNPFDEQVVEQVEKVLQKKIIPHMSCEEDIRYEIEKIYQH